MLQIFLFFLCFKLFPFFFQKKFRKQGHENKTELNISKARKIAILLFFNTSIINFLITIIYVRVMKGAKEASIGIYKDRGLIDSQHGVALTLSLVNNI